MYVYTNRTYTHYLLVLLYAGSERKSVLISRVSSHGTAASQSPQLLNKIQIGVSTDKIASVSSEAVQGYEKLETKYVDVI